MEIKGKLIQLLPLQTGTGKNGMWKKQDCILEIPGQYPKKLCFSIWGDKIQESILQIGNELTVSFDIESREYNGRWYTEVRAWKIEGETKTSNTANSLGSVPPPSIDDFIPDSNASDDLPF